MKKYSLAVLLSIVMANAYSQNVGIGTTSPVVRLDVNSTDNFTAKFNGANQMYLGFFETGVLRGYLGSFSGATEDFDIGTSSGNATGKLHLTTTATPRMTIDAIGNVGIGTTSPSASSILDMNSTTKGLLMPRMTTAQRTAIASPANGLMVYDITTSSFWYYNSSAWTNMTSGGGSFSLPYANNVNMAGPVFQVENSGNGDVLYIGNLGAGTGLTAYTVSGHAIAASSSSGYGMRTTSFSNYALYALSDNINNSLAAIRANNIGGGAGVHASSVNSNGVLGTSTHFQSAGVRGDATGEFGQGVSGLATGTSGAGVRGESSSPTGLGIYGFNANGVAIQGTSTTKYGVRGTVTNSTAGVSAGVYGAISGTAGVGVYGIADFSGGTGVYGYSTNGKGMEGFSSTYRAVSGTSNGGTALYGNSTTGYALETVGNVKISGGNTNPSAGAVLTSDASGNAVWKSKRVAFKTNSISLAYDDVPDETDWKIIFDNEEFDLGNNFEPYTGGVPGTDDATFIAPVTGLYHFNVRIYFLEAPLNDLESGKVFIRRQRGVSIADLVEAPAAPVYNINLPDHAVFNLSTDIRLQAGDKIWLMIRHDADLGGTGGFYSGTSTEFSGHLVFED